MILLVDLKSFLVDNEGDNFIIGQDTNTSGTINDEIFKIYKGSAGVNNSKVEIKNAKTRIEDLDFGA